MPSSAEKLREVLAYPRARAKAALPPLLWPDRANLVQSGETFPGRRGWRPCSSQFVTFAADSISSVPEGGIRSYS